MGSKVSSEHSAMTVKAAPEEEIVTPAEGYDKALFMATHTSFMDKMPSIKEQLKIGVRGLEFVVHVADGKMHVGKGSAGESANLAANGEDVGNSSLLEGWLSAVASWSKQRAGAHTPITVWLTLTNSFAQWGDFTALNILLVRVFGAMLFTPSDLRKTAGAWPSLDDMTGRVIVVLGGVRTAREGYRADVCDGEPSCAANSRGQLIVAHEREGLVVLWVGQYDTEEAGQIWERRRVVGPGRAPAVAVNDSGTIVLVHAAQTGPDIQYRVGRLMVRTTPGAEGDELDVEWLSTCSSSYDLAASCCISPAVALNNSGVVIAVHASPESEYGVSWRAALMPAEGAAEVRWLLPEEVGSPLQRLRVPGRGSLLSVSFEQPWSSDVTVVHCTGGSNNAPAPVAGGGSSSSSRILLEKAIPNSARGSPTAVASVGGTGNGEGRLPTTVNSAKNLALMAFSSRNPLLRHSSAPSMNAPAPAANGAAADDSAGADGRIAIRGIARVSQTYASVKGGLSVGGSGSGSGVGTPGRSGMAGAGLAGASSSGLKVTWAPGSQTQEKPGRSRVVVGEGSSRMFARVSLAPTCYSNEGRTLVFEAGPVAREDGAAAPAPATGRAGQSQLQQQQALSGPAIVRLPQLCFIEAQRSESSLLSDPDVRFVGCAPRDEAFAMNALETGRVLRMWRFNAASCKRSSVNPNFPATDFPESDWYLAYLNACGS